MSEPTSDGDQLHQPEKFGWSGGDLQWDDEPAEEAYDDDEPAAVPDPREDERG